jgi:hypothetical protein
LFIASVRNDFDTMLEVDGGVWQMEGVKKVRGPSVGEKAMRGRGMSGIK